MKRTITALTIAALLSAGYAYACDHCEGAACAEKAPEKGGYMQKMMDKDGDGKISKSEFNSAHEKKFARLDANNDGSIDEGERTAAFEKWHERKAERKAK